MVKRSSFILDSLYFATLSTLIDSPREAKEVKQQLIRRDINLTACYLYQVLNMLIDLGFVTKDLNTNINRLIYTITPKGIKALDLTMRYYIVEF